MKKQIISVILAVVMCLMMPCVCFAEEPSPKSVKMYEQSSTHNTMSSAQQIYQDYTLYGTISSSGENDYYVVTFGVAGKVNFWLGNIPSGCNYDLYIYNSYGNKVAQSTNSSNSQEIVNQWSVSANSTYYIRVVGVSGSSTSYYHLRCKWYPSAGFKYYCNVSPSGSVGGFPTANISQLVTNPNSYSLYSRLTTAGCQITSYAMVLKNLNKNTTASHYNPQTQNYSIMSADPVTVMFANMLFPVPVNNTVSYAEDPVSAYRNRIASAFGTTCTHYDISSLTRLQKIIAITYYLTQNPEGIVLRFSGSAGTHSLVAAMSGYEATQSQVNTVRTLIESNRSDQYNEENETPVDVTNINPGGYSSTRGLINDSNGGSYFTVFDPADYGTSTDGSLSLSSTWTAQYYSWSDLVAIEFFN